MCLKDKLVIIIIIMSILNILFLKDVNAKYVYTNTGKIFEIQNADNIFPEINGRNYSVENEYFNKNVTVDFSDNLGIKYGRYYYENDTTGTEFESGKTFEESGFYRIEVSDLYDNKTLYTFYIDKEVDEAEVCISSENNIQTLTFNMQDNISGVKKAEVYVDNVLYKTYEYSNIKEVSEEMILDDVKFYQEVYIIVYDFLENSKKSNIAILNEDKIYDVEDLFRFKNIVNTKVCDFAGKTVNLMSDLELNSKEWSSIVGFKGEFDGKYHTISGFYMDTDIERGGVFGINYGILRDFTVIGELNSTANISAGICAENFGQIVNCRSKVTINSTGDYVGGIVGINHGYIERCKNNYNITSTGHYVGGIVGYNKTTGVIKKCGTSGSITSNKYAGGVCGFCEGNNTMISIEQSYNMGVVKANSYVGGICGGTSSEIVNMAYLYNTNDIIETSGNGQNGGIIGENGSNVYIKNSYNIGNINSLLPNQIAPVNVNVDESFYILGKDNNSNKGVGIEEYLFKELVTNENSVLFLLSQNASQIWSIKEGYNEDYPILMWQLY